VYGYSSKKAKMKEHQHVWAPGLKNYGFACTVKDCLAWTENKTVVGWLD